MNPRQGKERSRARRLRGERSGAPGRPSPWSHGPRSPRVAWAAPAGASPRAPAPVANRRTPSGSAPRTMEVSPWVPGTAPSSVSAAKARDAATPALTTVTCSADARAPREATPDTCSRRTGGRAPAQLAAAWAPGAWGEAWSPGLGERGDEGVAGKGSRRGGDAGSRGAGQRSLRGTPGLAWC